MDQALERGDVVNSEEVSTWFVMAAATLVLYGFSGSVGMDLLKTCRGLIENSYKIPADGYSYIRVTEKIGIEVVAALAIPVLLLALGAIGGNMIQHRLVWST